MKCLNKGCDNDINIGGRDLSKTKSMSLCEECNKKIQDYEYKQRLDRVLSVFEPYYENNLFGCEQSKIYICSLKDVAKIEELLSYNDVKKLFIKRIVMQVQGELRQVDYEVSLDTVESILKDLGVIK